MARRNDPVPPVEDPQDKPIDQPERGPAPPRATLPERVQCNEDTLVERDDLGPGAVTFVAAGDVIPVGLEDHPRKPAA